MLPEPGGESMVPGGGLRAQGSGVPFVGRCESASGGASAGETSFVSCKGISDLPGKLLDCRRDDGGPLVDIGELRERVAVCVEHAAAGLAQDRGRGEEALRRQSGPNVDVCVDRAAGHQGDGARGTPIGADRTGPGEYIAHLRRRREVAELARNKGVRDPARAGGP